MSVENARLADEAIEAAALLSAAIFLQARIRGYLAREELQRCQTAAVTIQSGWRCALARGSAVAREEAGSRLRTFARRVVAGVRYRRRRVVVVRLQAAWRGASTRVRLAEEAAAVAAALEMQLALEERAAVVLQSSWRGAWTRVLLAEEAAAAAEEEMQFIREDTAAVALQAWARGWLEREEQGRRFEAAGVVQAAWRERQARLARARAVETAIAAAVVVQAWWRMLLASAELSRARYGREGVLR